MIARASLPFLAVLLLGACASDKAAPDQGMMVREAQARSEVLADRFQKELLSALTTAMATEGPQGAIGVCSSIAPALAAPVDGLNFYNYGLVPAGRLDWVGVALGQAARP